MEHANLENGRVIITYGRSIMALVAAHSLAKKGVDVIGCDSVDFTVISFSKYASDYFVYPDPDKDEQAFLDGLLQQIKKFKPEDERPYVLMPVFKDTRLIAKYKERFEPYIKVAAPDYKAIAKLHPKDHFAKTIQELDIAAPKTWVPEDEQALMDVSAELDYPVIIKPYDQAGGRGIHKVQNAEMLLQHWQDNQKRYEQKSLIQEMVDGEDYCLTGLFDHGECKASMAYKNLYRFPANDSGAGIMRETVEDERFKNIAADLMRPLKWNGVAEFDFLWDGKEGTAPSLIEVNTRFWGGLFQSVESGIDFPWLLYELTVNGTVEPQGEAAIGTRTKMPYIWLYSAIREMSKSDENFQEIEAQGRAALEKLKGGELWDGMKDYAAYLSAYWGETLNIPKKLARLQATLREGKTARDEFLNNEDPYTAFGILFIIGSLIRHGELPPEVKH